MSVIRRPTNPFRDDARSYSSDKADNEFLDQGSVTSDDNTTVSEYVDGDFGDDGVPPGFWDLVTNKNLYQHDTNQFLRRFETGADADIRTKQSYRRTRPIKFVESAPRPKVGVVFLPGADKPTVARLEQTGMVQKKPNQRHSTWRTNTAGQLLSTWQVNQDLGFVHTDITLKVIQWTLSRTHEPPPRDLDIVTIDSEYVEIVNELRDDTGQIIPGHDLRATLIEVDTGSLVRLITHFRKLVAQSTPLMVPEENVKQLETMMDDARFFYTRSPILFRMGTRLHIINSMDIRYGIDDEDGFRTIYTSEGIQNLITVSASYFNALDSAGTKDKNNWQASVRARFLQMLVLLLSMLAESDIKSMADFLLKTYGIKAERIDLELLFLKVIPLTSINSNVFLSALIPAVRGYRVPQKSLDDEPHCWEVLMLELAKKGYLLPATVLELGHDQHSWLAKWPQDGIKSSQILGRLQLHGTTSRGHNPLKGFNEILPINIGSETAMSEMTIYLHGADKAYIIDTKDYEHIHCLNPGTYMVRDAEDGAREYALVVRAEPLNDHANSAIRLINKIIPRLNGMFQRTSNRIVRYVPGIRRQPPPVIARDLIPDPEITRHEAWLEGTDTYIAVTWKCEGRNISRMDMLSRMARIVSNIRAVVGYFENITNRSFGRHDEQYRKVQHLCELHDQKIQLERNTRAPGQAPVSPITRSIHANDEMYGVHNNIWFDYESQYSNEDQRLHVWSQRDMVRSVKWVRGGTQAEVELAMMKKKFVVSALPKHHPDLEVAPADEIEGRDVVLLCGRYLVVAKSAEPQGGAPLPEDVGLFEMVNWLEIHSVDEQSQSARGRNRATITRLQSVFV